MFVKTARAGLVAAAVAFGGLVAPALAAPLGPDTALTGGPEGIVSVRYGHGRHGHHHHRGHHYGQRWGHHHHRHHGHWGHHHGGFGHHHRGRHHGHW